MLTFEEVKKNLLSSKKVKKEYDRLEAKYDKIKKECRKYNRYILIEEAIDSIKKKHCYECECFEKGNCHGCVVYDVIGELENASAVKEIEK